MDEIITFLTTPALWLLTAAGALLIWGLRHTTARRVEKHSFNRKTAKPGQLYSDGNTASSKLEKRVRNDIIKMGHNPYPGSTAIVTYPDERGKVHKYTPDIILKNRKVIIEVDPEFTHSGEDKLEDDYRRGKCYQDLGYGVVRLRLGKGLNTIGKYDVHFDQEDWKPDAMGATLNRMIKKAKPE